MILAIFRLNGLLLAAGDLLAAGHGLTSARWQVLGAVGLEQRPLTVPQIARRMGLTRQSVHKTVAHLVEYGMAELVPNSDHRRSHLVCLTEVGRAKYRALDGVQTNWVNRLSAGLTRLELETTARVLRELGTSLEAARGRPQQEQGDDHQI